MTLEKTEGTDTAEQSAPQEGQAAENNAEEPQSTQQPAESEAAEQPAESPGATEQPAAGEDSPESASPSPEAAVGASGARPLGDAEELAERASAATDELTEAAAEQPAAEEPAAEATAAPATEEQPAPESQPVVAEQAAADGRTAVAEQATAEDPAPIATATAVREGPEPTTMEELLNEQPGEIRSLKHGDVVEGTVVRIDKDEMLVDIGAKSEGVVSNRELYGRNAETQPELNIGDTVLVYVLQPESPEGHAVLSLRRAGLERKWRSMQEQFDAGLIIEAPVIDHNKGGLIVDCGIRGFVPISQIVDFPRRPQTEQPRDAAQEIAEKLQPYVGRKLRLKILEVNRKANRLILSEKVALYEERREKRDELFSSLQVGQTVKGTVRSIAPFGVFIDLGGIDGLVHKSELSWNKVNNPEAGYKIGDEVEAEVIDINHERGRISLSIRRLQPDPWHSSVADMKVGDLIDGAVTKIVNFGAFVRVRDGLEGLIHISELSHQRVAHPGDVVHEGQRLKLKVISLDSERHRLGLSLKQAEEAPPRPAERERRPRQERGYDPAQAVQEPEGGIDNTLAAAFAQVRQQMEQTEAARRQDDEGEEQPAAEPATAEPATEEQPAAEATAEPATAEPATEEQPAVEPATEEQPTAEATAEPATAEPATEEQPAAEPATEEQPTAEATAEPATAEPAAEEAPAAEATAEPATAEPAAEEQPAAEATAEPATAEPATEEQPTASGEPVADTSAEPAEGAADAAPEEGAAQEKKSSRKSAADKKAKSED